MTKNRFAFFSAVSKFANANLTVALITLIVGAYFAQRIVVIIISGVQLSIGLTVLVTLVFFVAMLLSFLLGVPFLFVLLVCAIMKTKPPWYYRVIVRMFTPILHLIEKFSPEQVRDDDKRDIADFQVAVAKYHKRAENEIEGMKQSK